MSKDPIEKERLNEDREKGRKREITFCGLMQKYKCFTYRFQEGHPKAAVLECQDKYILLPDVWVVREDGQNFFAEVKEKYPTKYGDYGLEEYRVFSLIKISDLTKTPVLYVIYDTRDREWYCANIKTLISKAYKNFWSKTYVCGEVKKLPVYYFQKAWFKEIEKDGELWVDD